MASFPSFNPFHIHSLHTLRIYVQDPSLRLICRIVYEGNECFDLHFNLTSVLLTREGALAAREDPEHEVGHPEGEEDDGVTEDQGQHQHQHHGPCNY